MTDSHNEINEQPPGKIFLIDKPIDYTSADIVRIFKRNLKLKKVGHSGTLDPKATGLLILCSDKMTKKISEFIDYDKEYEGIIRIGAKTKTFDTESEEEEIIDDFSVTDEFIENTARSFVGEISQMPPMYSALKHKGKPLYKIARKGKEIQREPRKIIVSRFDVKRIGQTEIHFKISSSKGTYIRSIANDFGEKLGVGGYLKTLRRTRIGNFVLENFTEDCMGIRFAVL